MAPSYIVTVYTTEDDIRPLVMTEDEVRDSYPHWGGKTELTSREGWRVTIVAQLPTYRCSGDMPADCAFRTEAQS